jgi:glycosyltransferase involved in cell wall biosynthesis
MRILAIATALDRPEAAIFTGLARKGAYIHVIATPSPEHRTTLEMAGIPLTEFHFRNRFDLAGMKLVRKLVREEQIDIVYALSNRALSSSVIALYRQKVAIAAYRGTVGHISWLDPSSWFTYLNPRVGKILCVSKAVESYLARVGVPQSRLTMIYKGHDPSWYQSPTKSQRAEFGIPEDAFVIGCTAVMRSVKGIDDLLDAAGLLVDELPTLHLLLVGSIKDRNIQRKIDRFPKPARLHLTGYRTDATALATLEDVTVMASKSREGFPKSVIEAMSQGVPAIVTSVGGMPELVGHGSAGLLVEPSNPRALADAILKLYRDPALRHTIGQSGRQRIATTFHIDDTIERTYREFAGLLTPQHQSTTICAP